MFTIHDDDKYLFPSQKKQFKLDVVEKSEMSKKNKSYLDKALIEAIVIDGRAFLDFNKKGMKEFIRIAVPGYKPPHRVTVAKRINELWLDNGVKLKIILKQIDMIALTSDLWTSKTSASFITLTAHFFDKSFDELF